MMILHTEILQHALTSAIRNGAIRFGGNRRLKIYGTLTCASGKRMKRENRAFFASEAEAIRYNYRPCGHCMKEAYKNWKNGSIQSNDR